jgi:hypothetical protein
MASIDTIIKPSCMLAWGFKIRGESRVTGRILNVEEVEERDDSRLIAELADLSIRTPLPLIHFIPRITSMPTPGRTTKSAKN